MVNLDWGPGRLAPRDSARLAYSAAMSTQPPLAQSDDQASK
jgi:hypothetical protein